MATSAIVTGKATPVGAVFNHELVLQNTSPAPFSIYSFMFGLGYNAPITDPFPLQNVVFISAPPGWSPEGVSSGYMSWHTSFQGSAVASGYILPGSSGTFMFQSTTPLPATMQFGCCFHSTPPDRWGHVFNGIATFVILLIDGVSLGRMPESAKPSKDNPIYDRTHLARRDRLR